MLNSQSEMMTSNGKGKSSLVPCTCRTKSLLAIRIGFSFLSNSIANVTQKAELASTLIMVSLPLGSSKGFTGALRLPTFGITLILTPSESGVSMSLPMSLI